MLHTLDPHCVFLSPDAYKEMNLSTSGHFGGLGIVISIRDQLLTIMRPMPGTPAGRAGLKRLDRIVKINNESTLNMPLDDAVKRLRGKPGHQGHGLGAPRRRRGLAGRARRSSSTREVIQVESVESRLLERGVGYVRLKQFQQSTSRRARRRRSPSCARRSSSRASCSICAATRAACSSRRPQVADRFLRGRRHRRHRRQRRRAARRSAPRAAAPSRTTRSSCSSTARPRAPARSSPARSRTTIAPCIVGQTTFGKGTVQLVFPRVTPDNAALKLTIAQYLTPGRRLDPGRRRRAGHRARPDDGRHAGDGSVPVRARPARARSVEEPVERAPAQRRAGRSSSCATTCRRASATRSASAAATSTTSSSSTSRSSSRATSSRKLPPGKRRDQLRSRQAPSSRSCSRPRSTRSSARSRQARRRLEPPPPKDDDRRRRGRRTSRSRSRPIARATRPWRASR